VAHRGGAGLWPENSLLAFQNATSLGVDLCECDVHLARDGEVAVIHDPTLERMTTGQGLVRDQTMQELRQARLKDRSGTVTSEHLPSLDELADLIRNRTVGLLVEIKTDQHHSRYPGIEEKVLEILDRHQLIERARIVSFDLETIQRVRALHGSVQIGGVFSAKGLARTITPVLDALTRLSELGASLVALEAPLVDERSVREAHSRGLSLAAWTVNKQNEMHRLISLGVDLLITDRPDLAKTLLRKV
jgi:glycerophosphoryl diester phosphodiesterase